MPQESGAATGLWRFEHVGGADEVRVRRVERYFLALGTSRSLEMSAPLAAQGDFACGCLRIERMNASPGTAGGEPAETSLVMIVDEQ